MIKLFKRFYRNSKIGKFLLHPLKRVYEYIYFHIVPEQTFIEWEFKKILGYRLDLNNPVTFNERLQWLKLNDRTPLHTICADKYAVRKYVSDLIGDEYLIPLMIQTENPREIIPQNLPDYPIIIKTNHDSGGSIIIKDKSGANWKEIQKILRKRLKSNYYYESKEWQYKNIPPCILVEKLLMAENGNIPYDYKFHCFHQKVEMIQVDIDRGTSHQCRNWYNRKWEREPYWKVIKPAEEDVDKPELLESMISLSEKLSDAFRYVRVDWYYVHHKIYFGELTFIPGGGFSPFTPSCWDEHFGKKLHLALESDELS